MAAEIITTVPIWPFGNAGPDSHTERQKNNHAAKDLRPSPTPLKEIPANHTGTTRARIASHANTPTTTRVSLIYELTQDNVLEKRIFFSPPHTKRTVDWLVRSPIILSMPPWAPHPCASLAFPHTFKL